uniref:Ribosomal protein S9 n=1 Tax=Monomorphina aenigmatica TaxID=304863 RepID=L0BHT5_MONAE|nr:ribosomal protein S9 [Monomorphina aenigmatica]AFZ88793.1 ribosomal protein S9 [Monomorphina aenigmatica]
MKRKINLKRKCATVLIKLLTGTGKIIINGKNIHDYMQNNPRKAPLSLLESEKNYDVIIKCLGGGLSGQAEAIKLALSRALYKLVEIPNQQILKENGFLTRNSLCKERRKYGLKKARKAPQFSKR